MAHTPLHALLRTPHAAPHRSTSALLLALLAVAGLPACQTDPTHSQTPRSALLTDAQAHTPPAPQDVAVPPGVDAQQLTPRTGEALIKAQRSLREAVAAVPVPAYLKPSNTPPANADDTPHKEPPVTAQKLYAFALLDLKSNKPAEATQKLEAAAKLAPGFAELHRLLAQTWLSLGNANAAAKAVEQALLIEPDLQSLLLVGRYALDTGKPEEAIAALHAAQQQHEAIPDAQADPATQAVIAFYLATALQRAGFDHAALDQYTTYQSVPRTALRGGSPSNELLFIDRRQTGLLIDQGDLYHRLDQPQLALQRYEAVQKLGISDPGLTARVLYTLLRLGRVDDATQRVTTQVTAAGNDPRSIALVQYATRNGVPPQTLVAQLREIYEQQDKPSEAMVLSLAAALPTLAAVELLAQHLQEQPDAHVVLDKLVAIELNDPLLKDTGPASAIRRSADAIDRDPNDTSRRVAALLAGRKGDAASILPAFDALDATTQGRPPVRLLQALLLSAAGQPDASAALLRDSLAQGPSLAAARVELSRQLAVDGKLAEAETLLAQAPDPEAAGVAELRSILLAQLGRRDEALVMMDQLIEKRPRQHRLIVERARVLEALDRVNDAERGLLDALTASPNEEPLYAALMELYERHGQLTQNYTWVARRLLANLPQSRLAKIVLAENFEAQRNDEQAERLLNEVLQDHPNDPQARALLIDIYLRTERIDEATALIREAIERQPRDADARRLLVRAMLVKGDQDAAAEVMEQYVKDFPGDALMPMQLVQTYASLERWADAVRHLDPIVRASPEDARVLSIAAIVYEQSAADRSKALPLHETLAELSPPGPQRNQHRAMALSLAGKTDEALAVVAVMVANEGDEESVVFPAQLTWRILQHLPPDEAVDRLITLLDTLPADRRMPVGYTTAIQMELRGDAGASERLLEKLLRDAPDDALLNNALGYRFAMQGRRLDEAKTMIQKALDAEPENGAYQDSMGWVLYKLGDFTAAEPWLRKALEREPYPVIADHLGDVLYRLNKPEDAKAAWEQARVMLETPTDFPDPEINGLGERIDAKLKALEDNKPVPVSESAK